MGSTVQWVKKAEVIVEVNIEELAEWERLLIYCPCMLGPYTLKGAIIAVQCKDGSEHYFATLGTTCKPIKATSDNDAARQGMALIGEFLFERLQSFEGDPFAYPVIAGNEEER